METAARDSAGPCVCTSPFCLASTLRTLHESTAKIINNGNSTPLGFVSCQLGLFTFHASLLLHQWTVHCCKTPSVFTAWAPNSSPCALGNNTSPEHKPHAPVALGRATPHQSQPWVTYLSLLVLLLLLMESLLEDRLLDPLPLGERAGLDAWLASRCGDWVRDWDECGDRLLLCW